MFKDRDIAILGAGALLAVLTALILPFSLAWKVIPSFLILFSFMLLALLRLGPDRVTLEEWIKRRIQFRLRARRYVYQQPKASPPAVASMLPEPPTPLGELQQSRSPHRPASPSPVGAKQKHLSLAFDEVGIYPLLTVFLAVVGVWFAIWVAQGGGVELSRIFQR
ncbi:MAG: hypothetical protein Q7U34_10910 [Anaerolineales bacterium]|nr:hypothetical protein [Anaerolineales bacterium]